MHWTISCFAKTLNWTVTFTMYINKNRLHQCTEKQDCKQWRHQAPIYIGGGGGGEGGSIKRQTNSLLRGNSVIDHLTNIEH